MSPLQLHIQSGSRALQIIDLPQGLTRMGRHPDNDLPFDDETVSACHCELLHREGIVSVRDLGSTNGTFIDYRKVQEAVLRIGQVLRLGSVSLALKDAPVHIAIPDLPVPALPPAEADGMPVCYQHSGSPAPLECAQCGKRFCELCVHQVRRVGGDALTLCPVCGGHCRAIAQVKTEKKRKSRVSSWLGKVTARITGRMARAKTE